MILALGGEVDAVRPAEASTGHGTLALAKAATRNAPVLAELVPDESLTPSEADLIYAKLGQISEELLNPEASAAATPRDPEEILEFGPMRIRRHLVETIVRAARATGVDPVLLMAIADKESSFSTGVKARTSSATGLFQFIESTWLQVLYDFGAKHGLAAEAKAVSNDDGDYSIADAGDRSRILELRRDPYVSALLAGEMLQRDRSRIARRIGRELSHGETYIAHFLGPDDAERFLGKMVDEPEAVAARLLPRPARANRTIFFARSGKRSRGLSVAEVHQKFESMMGMRAERYREVPQLVGSASAFAEVQ